MAVATTTNISIRMDKSLKKQADNLFNDLGMNMTTAFNIFVRECVRCDGIPFRVSRSRQLNQATIEAMLESEKLLNDPNTKYYDDADEMFKSILG